MSNGQSIIVEFTKLQEKDTTFSRLLLAIEDDKELRYIGAVSSARFYRLILQGYIEQDGGDKEKSFQADCLRIRVLRGWHNANSAFDLMLSLKS